MGAYHGMNDDIASSDVDVEYYEELVQKANEFISKTIMILHEVNLSRTNPDKKIINELKEIKSSLVDLQLSYSNNFSLCLNTTKETPACRKFFTRSCKVNYKSFFLSIPLKVA